MKTLDIILILFLLCLIIAGFLLGSYARSQGNKCVDDPLSYTEKALNDNCTCSCVCSSVSGLYFYYGENRQSAIDLGK